MILYTLHVVSMHLHNNKHAQNLDVHIVDLITLNSVLIPYTNHGPSAHTLVLPACASTCALLIRATVGVGINNIYKPKFPPTAIAKLLQYSGFRVEHRDEFSLHK